MLRLKRYLIPYLPIFTLTVILVFVQANAELALPDYMSRIVNNGIQQGGVENPIPEIVRSTSLDKYTIFMDESEKELVNSVYSVLEPGSPEYDEMIEKFPGINTETVYLLGEVDRDDRDRLESIMGRAELVVSGIQQALEDPSAVTQFGEGFDFDFSKIPPGTDVFSMLSNLPPSQLEPLIARINQQFDALGDSMISQMAVGVVKQEYEALGVDPASLQSRYILGTGGTMLLISLLGGVCTVAVGYLASRTAAGVARDLRKDVFQKVESFSSAELDKFSTASLITSYMAIGVELLSSPKWRSILPAEVPISARSAVI